MKTVRVTAAMATVWLMANVYAVDLNEDTLLEFLQATEQSFVDQDINGLDRALAKDAVITIKIMDKENTQTLDLDRQTYLNSLVQSWDLFDDFTYQRTLANTTLTDDTALVESQIQQQFTVEGEQIRQSSTETALIRLIEGELKLVRLDVLVSP